MKRYLDLVSISARVHRRQSRLTRLCIVLAVFLIAGIFGMADMEIRSMTQRTVLEQGAWHAMFPGLTDRQQSLIAQRAEVETSSRYAVTNYDLNLDYTVNDVKTGICGFDESMLTLFPALEIEDGMFPQTATEALATKDMKIQLGLLRSPCPALLVIIHCCRKAGRMRCFSTSMGMKHTFCPILSPRTWSSMLLFLRIAAFRMRLIISARCTIWTKVRWGRTRNC